MPGGRWRPCPLPMTDAEAERHAQSYAGVGFVPELEKIAGSEQQDQATDGLPMMPSGGPSAPGFGGK